MAISTPLSSTGLTVQLRCERREYKKQSHGDCSGKKDLDSMVVSGDDVTKCAPGNDCRQRATNCNRVRLQKQVRSPALCRRSTASGVVSVRLRVRCIPCSRPRGGTWFGGARWRVASAVLRAASLSAMVGAGDVIAGSLARLSIGSLTCDDLWKIFDRKRRN